MRIEQREDSMPDQNTETPRPADAAVDQSPAFVREYAKPQWVQDRFGNWSREWPEDARDIEHARYHHRP